MKEIHEFRIFKEYYNLLPMPNNAKFNGMVYVLKIEKEDPLFGEIGKIDKEVRKKYKKAFFGFWNVKRIYTQNELDKAKLFHVNIKTAFEPTGEECGTIYDETYACDVCGAYRKQISYLKLKKGSIPKKDIARTIAGEVVVSEKFTTIFKQKELKGIDFKPIYFDNMISNYYQLIPNSIELELNTKTIVGKNPHDLSTNDIEKEEFDLDKYNIKFDKIVVKCPKGHTLGTNLISEPFILDSISIKNFDFFKSKQMLGSKQGLLRPEPLYFCSPDFRNMVLEEKLSGFEFEIANIETPVPASLL